MTDDDRRFLEQPDEYLLIRILDGYAIFDKRFKGIVRIEDSTEHDRVVQKLLEAGVKVVSEPSRLAEYLK